MKTKKAFSGRKILALILALVMAISVMPVALAAEPGFLNESGQMISLSGGWRTGLSYVTVYFSTDIDAIPDPLNENGSLNYTFVQMQDDDVFELQMLFAFKKNSGVNRGRLLGITTSGLPSDVTWKNIMGGLTDQPWPCDFGTSTYKWTGTVNFKADGSKVYNAGVTIDFEVGATLFAADRHQQTIPVNITVIDKRPLLNAIREAYSKQDDLAYCSEDSVLEFEVALNAAEAIAPAATVVTQDEVTKAANALTSAIAGLDILSADYTALDAAKADAKAILDDEKVDETYTVDSLALLREKYEAALAIPSDLSVREQARVDTAAGELADAVAKLVKFANYTALQAAVNNFSKLNPSYFDADAFAAVKALADEAKEALKPENRLPATEQATVNAQALALNRAIAGLKKLPADYDAFDAAVAEAKAKLESSDIQNYTAVSVKALEEAYLASADVLRDKDITYQATVDAAAKAITDALAGLTLKGADYTKLDAAIAAAEAELKRSDIADFTDESVEALETALAAAKDVSRMLTVDQQNVIDAASEALVAATHLTLKGADYTSLDAAVEAREAELAAARESGKYTDASMARLESAINVAKAVDRTYSIKEQSMVDDAVKALNGVQLEKKAADTSALEAAIEAAQQTLNEAGDEYTDESKAALSAAIKEAREALATYGGDIENQPQINAALESLKYVSLELKKADYSALDAAIEAAEEFLADPETEALYTPETIQAVKDALDEAKNFDRTLDITRQDEVNTAAGKLETVMPGDSGYKDADLTALKAAIAAADEKLAAEDIADYTDASVEALRAARDEAQALADRKPNVTEQDAVNAQAAALNAMELTLKSADYAALEAAVVKATLDYEKAEASGLYTASSLEEFMAAIISANALLDNQNLTIKDQKVLDDAAAALAVELVYRDADLTALLDAIAAAEAKMAAPGYADYTAASRAAFEEALNEARALRDETPNILRQDEVNAAADKLNNIKLSLQGADYTALDEVIAQAQALVGTDLSDKYTAASIKALEAALVEAENVDRALDVSDQDYVDAAVQALRDAIDGLVPYNKVAGVEITQNGAVVDGDVAYVKVPWYKMYKNQSTTLGYQLSGDADVASVKWELANWSVDNPEATVVDNGDGTVTVTQNGKGIGARSCWVKVTVTDVNGNTVEDVVKVRFYKWSWQV